MRLRALIVVVLALASCSSGRKAATPSPSLTASPTPRATASPQPTSSVDARAVDARALVKPHAVTKTIYADMDGDGTEEIAVWSQANEPPEGSFIRQSYIEVFARRGGAFTKVFDGAKETVLTSEPDAVSQDVAFFDFVDFRGNGRSYLTLGIQNVGASNGPLDVWAIRWDGHGALDKEFNYSTERGGTLVESGKTLQLETGAYKPGDPGCCPSGIAHIVIGYKDGKVQIASRTQTPTSPQP